MLYIKKIHQRCQATEWYQFTRGQGWSALTANYCCEVQCKLMMVCASVRAVSRRSQSKFCVLVRLYMHVQDLCYDTLDK